MYNQLVFLENFINISPERVLLFYRTINYMTIFDIIILREGDYMSNTVPENMKTKKAMALNQDILAKERTQLSITRTELAFLNTKMALNRTHLSYLRTILTLLGSAATLYKALPLIGVSLKFTSLLCLFLFVFAVYFIYKDATLYPKTKRELEEMESQTKLLEEQTSDEIFDFDIDQ